jgi:ferredoxin
LPDSKSKPESPGFICIWKCGVCTAVCGESAILHGSEIFEIDVDACSRCLLCVRTCPAGIIEEDLFA